MSEEGVPTKRKREDGPDEQPDLRKLIETNISATQEIKTIVNNQEKNSKAMVNNQNKILEKFEKLEKQGENYSKTMLEKIEKLESRTEEHNNSEKSLDKTFVLKETFLDVQKMNDGEERHGTEYEHFGRKWNAVIKRSKEYIYISLVLKKETIEEKISVQTSHEVSIKLRERSWVKRATENRLWSGNVLLFLFLFWEDMDQRNARILSLEVRVKLHKIESPIRMKFHHFDVSNEKFSNVILNVDGHRFNVLKELLSMHSPYFEKLFTGGFQESGKPEVTLKEVDPQDFQNFLEALHGYPAVDDSTVEGILLLNDVYDAKVIGHRCKEFLIDSSKLTVSRKLQLAARYQIEGLMDTIISNIKDAGEYRKLVTEEKNNFGPETLKALLDKGLTFHSS
ncbi:unnamed protein product [Caenorhabditis nigoni]